MEKLLVVRISNWGIADMDVSLFQDRGEWQEMIQLFSNEPIDAISVSCYDAGEKAFGTDKTMAGLTREATELPILVCGKIHDKTSAEAALADADLVLSGKSMLLNPSWVQDVKAGKSLKVYSSDEAGVAYTDTVLP
jgi:2,4-dienoyl-CoA reductase-like NADH-dependent reductase (Old Yellow Enzyme family)